MCPTPQFSTWNTIPAGATRTVLSILARSNCVLPILSVSDPGLRRTVRPVRARRIPVLPVLGWGLLGAIIFGAVAPGLFVLFDRWWGIELYAANRTQIVFKVLQGAAAGFVGWALYAIIRARPKSISADPNS
jgi:hypothetical protein